MMHYAILVTINATETPSCSAGSQNMKDSITRPEGPLNIEKNTVVSDYSAWSKTRNMKYILMSLFSTEDDNLSDYEEVNSLIKPPRSLIELLDKVRGIYSEKCHPITTIKLMSPIEV